MPTLSHLLRSIPLVGILGLLACGAASDEQTVGPRGGVVRSTDGRISVTIPAGALSDDVAISIEMVDDAPEDAVGPTYEMLPLGTAFRIPATIFYDFSELDMSAFDPDTLALVVAKGEQWFYLADQRERGTSLSASTVYLSAVSLVADEIDDDNGDHDPGDDGNGKKKDGG